MEKMESKINFEIKINNLGKHTIAVTRNEKGDLQFIIKLLF